MFLGWREMRNSPGRYIGIVALITLITYLVFFLTGLAYGLAESSRSALDKMPARGMIISSYANDSVAASRVSLDALKDVPGADNVNVQPIILSVSVASAEDANGKKLSDEQFQMAMLGFQPDSFLKPKLLSGAPVTKNGEAVIAESIAENRNVKIGDYLQVEQSELQVKIVGIAENAEYSVAPVAYLTLADAAKGRPGAKWTPPAATQSQQPAPAAEKAEIGAVNAFVIGDHAPQNLLKVSAKTGSGDVEYKPMSDIIWALPGYAAQVYTFVLMIGFLVVIAAVVIGIFMYILTIQKKPIFGVLKAQGIPNRYIAYAVLFQTALVALAGIVLGLVFTLLTALVLPASAPYQTNWLLLAAGAVIIFLVAGIGAQISVRQVSKIDPLEAMN